MEEYERAKEAGAAITHIHGVRRLESDIGPHGRKVSRLDVDELEVNAGRHPGSEPRCDAVRRRSGAAGGKKEADGVQARHDVSHLRSARCSGISWTPASQRVKYTRRKQGASCWNTSACLVRSAFIRRSSASLQALTGLSVTSGSVSRCPRRMIDWPCLPGRAARGCHRCRSLFLLCLD